MNENESVDVESAYGSQISSDSGTLIKKDTFTIEDSTSKNQIRWKWLKHKLRDYMVLRAVFFLLLIFLIITCYRITSQNQETHDTILNMQSQLNSFHEPASNDFMKQIFSQNQETQRMILSLQSQFNLVQKHIEKDFMNMKEETGKVEEKESENTMKMLEDVLKEAQMKTVLKLEQSQSNINGTTNQKDTHVPPAILTVPTNSTFKRINEASLLAGSKVDVSLSSSSSLYSLIPIFGFDQSDLVLVDRPEPPVNKAWCTYDKIPVLTLKLANYIKPTAVSYQHSKWNGTISDDAPKEYSVEACLDNNCMSRKPLFSHCEYNQHGLQEQICKNVSNDSISSPVGKLQFQFYKNHGDTERTCVSLVRVYSGTKLVQEEKFRGLEDTTTCIDLNHDYHNNPLIYKYFIHKDCALLFSKGCCQECPECCEDCDIEDINAKRIVLTILFMAVLLSSIVGCFYSIYMFVLACKETR